MKIEKAWEEFERGNIPSTNVLKLMLNQVTTAADYLYMRVKHYGWATYIDARQVQHKLEDLIKLREEK